MGKKLSNSEFIVAAKLKHGEDTYDYTKTNYTGNAGVITIGCKIHGDFTQVASEHMRGRGCNQCSKENKRDSSETAIQQFVEVHGDTYDYSLVEYINNKTDVKVICKTHGVFEVRPGNHKNGTGCPKCRNKKTGDRLRLSKGEFITKARNIHGSKYEYGNDYKSYNDQITITCRIHGDFKQLVKNHLDGSGCPQCGTISIGEKNSNHFAIKEEYKEPIITIKVPKYGKDQFVEHANKVHQNRYNYDKVEYSNNHTNVIINCSIHGDFKQDPGTHLKGHGCPQCGIEKRSLKSTENIFSKKGVEIYGDKYDYSKCGYKNWDSLEIIICPKHGEFQKSYKEHIVRKKGCKLCEGVVDDTKSFIHRARSIHGDKYSYLKSDYTGTHNNVIITCAKHGDFEMRPSNHLSNKQGCVKCRNEKFRVDYRRDGELFFIECKKVHKDFYDYSKSIYLNNKTDIEIGCPIHGFFWQEPNGHRMGRGCPKCGIIKMSESRTQSVDTIIARSIEVHGNRYNYSQSVPNGMLNKMEIICEKHGSFLQTPSHHIYGGCGCPLCAKGESKWEREIGDYINSLGVNFTKDRTLANPFEIDIYVPDRKIAWELNGLYFHSELSGGKSNIYHRNKTDMCAKKGVTLYQFFDDEWRDKKEIIKSMIKSKLGKIANKIYARKCNIQECCLEEYTKFVEDNHIQGYANASVKLGLYKDDELVAVMGFIKNNKYEWELNRFCGKIDTVVVGGAHKLLKHFIDTYNPKSIVSFADLRLSKGDLYHTLGFKLIGEVPVSYFYTENYFSKMDKRGFRHDTMPHKLANYDPTKDEWTNMRENGYDRVWDCGKLRFLWSNE